LRIERGLLRSTLCAEPSRHASVRLRFGRVHSERRCLHDDGRLLQGNDLRDERRFRWNVRG
jgi:hypothetical protein